MAQERPGAPRNEPGARRSGAGTPRNSQGRPRNGQERPRSGPGPLHGPGGRFRDPRACQPQRENACEIGENAAARTGAPDPPGVRGDRFFPDGLRGVPRRDSGQARTKSDPNPYNADPGGRSARPVVPVGKTRAPNGSTEGASITCIFTVVRCSWAPGAPCFTVQSEKGPLPRLESSPRAPPGPPRLGARSRAQKARENMASGAPEAPEASKNTCFWNSRASAARENTAL